MTRILYFIISAILFTGCTVAPVSEPLQTTDKSAKTAPHFVLQDELLNEPPENPRYVIAQPPLANAVDQAIAQSMTQQLQQLGYAQAQSRQDANVLVWYRYQQAQGGEHVVGEATDPWAEHLTPATNTGVPTATINRSDISSVKPISFTVEFISLTESSFPDLVMKVWHGEWSSSAPSLNIPEFTATTLPQLFAQYQSERTQNQIAAFAQARERKMQQAINTYMKLVMYRIQSNWKKPKHNVKGKQCKVKIVQSLVGEIKSHKLLSCDKDRRFRKSIDKAIKASSPLPMPREKEELFDRREIILIFQG